MFEYMKRFLLALFFSIIIGLLIIGSHQTIANAQELVDSERQWAFPTDGIISDTYGTRNGSHMGIDIASDSGTPIFAVESGIVSKSYYSNTYGNVVFIKHASGYETVYAHLKKRLVKESDQINKGDCIGYMGNTGRSSGPHLHFEVHENEWTVDKSNSIDPVKIFGYGEIGQTVSAIDGESQETVKISEKVESTPRSYIVEKGDTLWELSKVYKLSISSIKKINHLNNDMLYPGQRLFFIHKESSK